MRGNNAILLIIEQKQKFSIKSETKYSTDSIPVFFFSVVVVASFHFKIIEWLYYAVLLILIIFNIISY